MAFDPGYPNAAEDAHLIEQKPGTSSTVDDGGGSLTVDGTVSIDDTTPVEVNVQQPVSVDDNGGSLTVDGEVLAKDFLIEVSKGSVAGHSVTHKFGYASVGTSIVPITSDLVYQSPSSAVTLEFVSSSALDATGSTGATKITYEGLDANWDRVINEIDTNGTAAVTLPDDLVRLDRWYVSESGSYADLATPSYAGTLTIQASGAGALWSSIPAAIPFPAQSEIGVYALARNKRAYIISKHLFTDTGKTANLYMLHRQYADDVTAPYAGARRLLEREIGISGTSSVVFEAPKGPIIGPADIGFVGNVVSGSADISVEFDLLIIDDGF